MVKVTVKDENVTECMFDWMISSEPQIILIPNMVLHCSIMSQIVMQKNWFTVFNVKVTARTYIIKI